MIQATLANVSKYTSFYAGSLPLWVNICLKESGRDSEFSFMRLSAVKFQFKSKGSSHLQVLIEHPTCRNGRCLPVGKVDNS